GNVRELQNAIERAVILSENDEVNLEDLPEEVRTGRTLQEPSPAFEITARINADPPAKEKARIERALSDASGNRDRAAELLGISRTTLWRRMKKLGL
ncbi:MAG: helix-turn-helix domain-containing protein, partial [Planctomycetota bacterium]